MNELTIHLRRAEDLLAPDPTGLLDPDGDDARTAPGVDDLLAELLARPRPGRRRDTVVITMPPAAIEADTRDRLAAGLARWTARRYERCARESAVLWRQGLFSLRSGTVLFVIGLVLSSGFLESDVPGFLQDVLGNGVFLVIAWVGLWYPLDSLFFARLPLRRERKALEALRRMPVEVRPAGEH